MTWKDSRRRKLSFLFKDKEYKGASAVDIVRAQEREANDYPHRGQSIRTFLKWSLENLRDRIPPRDLDLSDALQDDELALSYLYLRDEYGAGNLSIERSKGEGL